MPDALTEFTKRALHFLRNFARKSSSRSCFFLRFYRIQIMSNLCKKCKKKERKKERNKKKKKRKMGVIDFVSEIKCVEKYPDFEKLAHVTQHGLQKFIFKNIEGESTEANDLGHIM